MLLLSFMPNLEKHCKESKKRYGYDFKEIHEWMDAPAALVGGMHRKLRHNLFETPQLAKQLFNDKIPKKYRMFIEDAVVNHILLDNKRKKSKKTEGKMIRKVGNSLVVSISPVASKYLESKYGKKVRIFMDTEKISIGGKGVPRKLRKVASSFVLTIPSQLAKIYGFEEGTEVIESFEELDERRIIFKKLSTKKEKYIQKKLTFRAESGFCGYSGTSEFEEKL